MVGKLYEALGVDSDAPPEEIQRAYRKAAKKAHPDAGGSPEQFALISLARECLSDAQRRAKYDATGDAGETTVDDTFAKALQLACNAVNMVVQKMLANGRSPMTVDIVAAARQTVREEIGKTENVIAQQRKNAKDLRKIAKRFRAKESKQNRLGPMFEANARQEDDAVESNGLVLAIHKKAYEILGEHDFDVEKQSYDEMRAAHSQTMGGLGQFFSRTTA